MATWTPLFRRTILEYAGSGLKRDMNSSRRGTIAGDGMRHMAGKYLIDSRQYGGAAEMADVISKLREAATSSGCLDSVYVRSRGDDIEDQSCLIPEGATNRQIIDMLERASREPQ